MADSALRAQTALDAKHFGMGKWWAILAASLAGAAAGTLLLIHPFEGGRAVTRLMGAALVLYGVENLLVCCYTVKVPRRSSADSMDALS